MEDAKRLLSPWQTSWAMGLQSMVWSVSREKHPLAEATNADGKESRSVCSACAARTLEAALVHVSLLQPLGS